MEMDGATTEQMPAPAHREVQNRESVSRSDAIVMEDDVVSVDGIDENPEPIVCADSEFNDFETKMSSFAFGQTWALYDDLDDMPRCYALIKRIIKSKSSLEVTWIVPKDDEDSVPVACGMFEYGITETRNRLAFSHEVHSIRYGRHFIAVNPRKGETWALFRDWNRSWINNFEHHKRPYKYDVVEILIDFDKDLGLGATYLGKVKGFVSVFKPAEQHGVVSFMIPREDMQRFSHRVPSFRLSGEEKEGVPVDSFELDPAAIPSLDCGEVEDRETSNKEIPIIILD